MNDTLNDNVSADVQEQTLVPVTNGEGTEILIPVGGEVSTVQDTEFCADPAGN